MPEKKNPRPHNLEQKKTGNRALPAKSSARFGDDEWEELQVSPENSAGLARPIGKPKGTSWLKKNPNAAKAIAAGGLLVVLLLLVGWSLGWFGASQTQTPPLVAQPQTSAAAHANSAARPSTPPQQPAKSEAGSKAAAEVSDEASKKEQADKEANLPLPDDVSKWKKEDYFRARRQNDPRLLLAISRLAEKARGSAAAAQGLTELLKPLPADAYQISTNRAMQPDQSPRAAGKDDAQPSASKFDTLGKGGYQPMPADAPATAGLPSPADLTRLVETIIAALGEIGTDVSLRTCEQILSGSLPTDDDKAAVDAVLRTLATHSSTENNDLLMRAIIAPDDLRPADRQGPWTAKDLRARAFELIKLGSSGELRAKLADVLADRLLRLAAGDPIREFLLAADPLNCGAQIVLYQKADPSKEIKTRIEQQLTAYSIGVLASVLGLSSDASVGAANYSLSTGYSGGASKRGAGKYDDAPAAPTFSPTPAYNPAITPGKIDVGAVSRIANMLWADKFRETLQSELGKLPPLDKQSQLFVLASTMPLDSTRAALAKALKKRWSDGPKALEVVGFGDTMLTDPGLLVILKSYPRRQVKSTTAVASARGSRSGRAPSTAGKGGGEGGVSAAQKKEQAEQDWMAISSKLVAAWCARFQAAALAKEKAATELGADLVADAKPKLPPDLTLPEGAKVLAAHHISLPAEAPAVSGEQKPSGLEVYYIRAEENNKQKKAMGYYARQFQMKMTEMHTTADNKAMWLDGVRMVPQTDQRRSIDVIISRSDNQAGDIAKETEATDLIVEILTIQIKDPRE